LFFCANHEIHTITFAAVLEWFCRESPPCLGLVGVAHRRELEITTKRNDQTPRTKMKMKAKAKNEKPKT
jgi:hypothetical protein